jgi:hypothetical protein
MQICFDCNKGATQRKDLSVPVLFQEPLALLKVFVCVNAKIKHFFMLPPSFSHVDGGTNIKLTIDFIFYFVDSFHCITQV